MTAPTCPYCTRPAVLLASSATLYGGRDFGPAWACEPCGAWVGCHKGGRRPLGRLADKALRAAKQRAHAAFDPMWKGGEMSRRGAYAWLADALGIAPKACHIGMFDEATCARVVDAVEQQLAGEPG